MQTVTWKDPHGSASVRFVDNRVTGEVTIVIESNGVVQGELDVPTEAMESFGKAVVGDQLTTLLKRNGFAW